MREKDAEESFEGGENKEENRGRGDGVRTTRKGNQEGNILEVEGKSGMKRVCFSLEVRLRRVRGKAWAEGGEYKGNVEVRGEKL